MSWLLRHNWMWSLLAFLLGAVITWVLLERRQHFAPAAVEESVDEVGEKEEVLVGATVADATPAVREKPAVRQAPAVREAPGVEPGPVFSQLMEPEPTRFEVESIADEIHATHPQTRAEVPTGRYGEGSADAVPHQGPPDGFTIKGNAQSMLFHTPDSPYYGRTKPGVWFRTESDAERAGFTKYTRRPRKSANPQN